MTHAIALDPVETDGLGPPGREDDTEGRRAVERLTLAERFDV